MPNVQHRRLQRVEEHRHHQGGDQDGGPAAGQKGRRGHGPDHARHRPQGPRHALRHRLKKATEGTRLGAEPAV